MACTYALGCWGVGNVGDEAILQGMRLEYGDALRAIFPDRLKPPQPWVVTEGEMRERITAEDTFVIGGGGLLFSAANIEMLLGLARHAKQRGASVLVRGVGCEGEGAKRVDLVRELCALCDGIEVRSAWSADYLRGLGIPCERGVDFAFRCAPPDPCERTVPLLFVPKSDADLGLDRIRDELARLANSGESVVVSSHVPEHFLNDALSEWEPFSGMVADLGRENVSLQRIDTVPEALALYARAQRVVTMRYHGLIFAHLARTPAEPLGSSLKLASFRPPAGMGG